MRPGLYSHPFELLGLDPSSDDLLDEKSVNRARKRAIADIETADGQAKATKDDVIRAADSLHSVEESNFYLKLWQDEPLIEFMRTGEVKWAKRVRWQDYYTEDQWDGPIRENLATAIRTAVTNCARQNDGDGVSAILSLEDEMRIPLSVSVHECISLVCSVEVTKLKNILDRLQEGHDSPNEELSNETCEVIRPAFYNALPGELVDCRNNIFAKARSIAICSFNDFDEPSVSLKILCKLGELTINEGQKGQLQKDTETISAAVDHNAIFKRYASQMAEVGKICDEIKSSPLKDSQLISFVRVSIERIKLLANQVNDQASLIMWDRCIYAIRGVSVDTWNKHSDYATSGRLIQSALDIPASDEAKDMVKKDLEVCCETLSKGAGELLVTLKTRIMEMKGVVISRGSNGINWGKFNDALLQYLNGVEKSDTIKDLAPFFRHSPRLQSAAWAWVDALRQLCFSTNQALGTVIDHLQRYPSEWTTACTLRDELIARKASITKRNFIIAGVIAAIVIALIIAGNTNGSSSGSSSQSYSPPTSYTPTYSPPRVSIPIETPIYTANGTLVDADFIYESEKRKMIIEAIRNRVTNDGVDQFNAYVNTFNNNYSQYRYYQSAMNTAKSRFNANQSQIRSEAEGILRRLNLGMSAE